MFSQAPRTTLTRSSSSSSSTASLVLNPSMPYYSKAHGGGSITSSSGTIVNLAKVTGRDGSSAAFSSTTSKQSLLLSIHTLQTYLTQLQELHTGTDIDALNQTTYKQTEEILFDSRTVCREIAEALKNTTQTSDSTLTQIQPVFLALQNSIEKVAKLLLDKHQLPTIVSIAAASSGGGDATMAPLNGKRKRIDTTSVHTEKRVKGGVISSDTKSAENESSNASSSSAFANLDPAEQVQQRVEGIEAHVLGLRMLQKHLASNANEQQLPQQQTRFSSRQQSKRSSGLSTPAKLRNGMEDEDERMTDDVSDNGPSSVRSNTSSTSSQISEADSDTTIQHRQGMIDELMENVLKLKKRIEEQKDAKDKSSMIGEYKSEDTDMNDPSSSSFASPPSAVPSLDLSSLTSTCTALETLLAKSLHTMASLAALQEKELRKRGMREEIKGKRLDGNADSTSIFVKHSGSSFAAKPFGMNRSESTSNKSTSSTSTSTTHLPSDIQSLVNPTSALELTRRSSHSVGFSSAPRFADGSSTTTNQKKKQHTSKAAERKAQYDAYDRLYAETQQALREAERNLAAQLLTSKKNYKLGVVVVEDEVTAAFNAIKPKLIQNVLIVPPTTTSEAPKSATAALILKERAEAEKRTKEMGPGQYQTEVADALTQRRVGGVTSWGAGPVVAMEQDGTEEAKTERLPAPRSTTAPFIGPGSHVVSDALTTRRVTGAVAMRAPLSEAQETEQHRRVREQTEEQERKKEEREMEKDVEMLDATVRKRVPAIGALLLPEPSPEPTQQKNRALDLLHKKMKKVETEYAVREEKIDELARTRRVQDELAKTMRYEEMQKMYAEEMKQKEQERLALVKEQEDAAAAVAQVQLALGPNGELVPYLNYPSVLPRAPAFRYAPPTALKENEYSRHGVSARKRSAAQLEKQSQKEAEVQAKLVRVEAHMSKVSALRSASVLALATMPGRPIPKPVEDKRDYSSSKSKDFIQLRENPGIDWSRASVRAITEPDQDPEIQDLIGGEEGDVLDLIPEQADKLTKPKLKGYRFGPSSGPSADIGWNEPRAYQTLSDTELDYENGILHEREILYPNHDFIKKRRAIGGALPFNKMVLGGSRSDGDDDYNDALEFPYLQEGNMDLNPNPAAVRAKVQGGKFAVRREEFEKLHRVAKEREAIRVKEESEKLILNPHLSTATLPHKPAASLVFSARHDTGGDADDELDDMEAYGIYHEGIVKKRGGPAEYDPKYGWKDMHTPGIAMQRMKGREDGKEDDDEFDPDNRDFMGGIHALPSAARLNGAPLPNSSLPGSSFGLSAPRPDPDADRLDFPETIGSEGGRLDLNPKQANKKNIATMSMSRTTGREEKDELDIEADAPRLDLGDVDKLKLQRKAPGVAWSLIPGRIDSENTREADERRKEAQTDITPDLARLLAVDSHVQTAVFGNEVRFDAKAASEAPLQTELDKMNDAILRHRASNVLFNKSVARPPLTIEELKTVLQPEHPSDHYVPTPDFALSEARGKKKTLEPLEKGDTMTALIPNPEAGRPYDKQYSFSRATRGVNLAEGLSAEQRLLLDVDLASRSGVGGQSFSTSQRASGKPLIMQEGLLLYPDKSEDYIAKHHPEWIFDKEQRFKDGKMDAFAATQLLLRPNYSSVEPHTPDASFTQQRRSTSLLPDGLNAEDQQLALLPQHGLVLARHPVVLLGNQERFPLEQETTKQSDLNPNLNAIRPKSPAAIVTGRYTSKKTVHEEAAVLEMLNENDEDAPSTGLAALSLSASSIGEFGLPDAGVVGNTASLVRARRETQKRDAERLLRQQEKEARRIEREKLAQEKLHPMVVSVEVIQTVPDEMAESTRVVTRFETPQPSVSSLAASSVPTSSISPSVAPAVSPSASPPTPSVPRKSVKFAVVDEVQVVPSNRNTKQAALPVSKKPRQPIEIAAVSAAGSRIPNSDVKALSRDSAITAATTVKLRSTSEGKAGKK